ncbi:MAG: sarcosine oxidase subunit gamma [Gammaproteobacteria bacterium]|nr:sarcosine oxidase subunit gamma [Gammaproteobacteria bacterium]
MPEAPARHVPSLPSADWMSPLPPATRLAFQGGLAARAAAARVFPLPDAQAVCQARCDGDRAGLWLGPDECLLLAPATTGAAALLEALRSAIGTAAHSLVDVSHRQVGLEIRGPQAERILNGACPLDLSLEQFPVGRCTRTVLAKAEIVLWRTQAQHFRVEIWRSFAAYAAALLQEIARDYVV